MMERKVVRQTSGPEENVQPRVAMAGTVYQSHHLQSTVPRLLTHKIIAGVNVHPAID
jgi:hypothetical protein